MWRCLVVELLETQLIITELLENKFDWNSSHKMGFGWWEFIELRDLFGPLVHFIFRVKQSTTSDGFRWLPTIAPV